MKCDIRREGGAVIFAPSGRIGVAEAVELRNRLFPELTDGVTDIVFRMEEVTDLDSSGLGLLLAVRNLSADIGARLELRGADARIGPKLAAIGLV
ncbi:STAS domain-containing protein [Cohnella sp. JJ-181]|uniref:STAS domain-containing protein n=1 Tax=Cohnella rhizoplanae TaxID=2974897 RepID=UPI0022FF6C9B|nr:STAS domain-containing protein [Cohnella sp. JJ-181]CAI6086911.1 hypothetical protein COHCIP112018_05234 [Cohnella sp. JJ-181]